MIWDVLLLSWIDYSTRNNTFKPFVSEESFKTSLRLSDILLGSGLDTTKEIHKARKIIEKENIIK